MSAGKLPVFDAKKYRLGRVAIDIYLRIVGGAGQTMLVLYMKSPDIEFSALQLFSRQVAFDRGDTFTGYLQATEFGDIFLRQLQKTDRVEIDLGIGIVADLITQVGHEITDQYLTGECRLDHSGQLDCDVANNEIMNRRVQTFSLVEFIATPNVKARTEPGHGLSDRLAAGNGVIRKNQVHEVIEIDVGIDAVVPVPDVEAVAAG